MHGLWASSHIIMVDFIVCGCMGTSSHIITVDFILCGCMGTSSHIITDDCIVCSCMGTSSHIITDDCIVCTCTGTSSHIIAFDFKHIPGAGQIRASLGSLLRVSPGLHLFNKPGWWLTVPSRMARDSRCCAGLLWCYWLCMGRHVHSGCLLQSVGYCSWLRCCRSNTWCWLHCLGGRQVCGCSRSYTCGDALVRLDGIWMTFAYVVLGTLILSTTNDLDKVWSMVCCMDDSGREPQASGIIENRYRLSSKQGGLLSATLMVVVCCA